jgi:hypothetical protein
MFSIRTAAVANATMLVALLLCATGARADYFDGNSLHTACQQNKPAVMGYVAGMADRSDDGYWATAEYRLALRFRPGLSEDQRNDLLNGIGAVTERLQGYCAPKNATLGQIGEVFCNYIRDNPTERTESGSKLFTRAMKQFWPCARP